jgi:hypothetical protein
MSFELASMRALLNAKNGLGGFCFRDALAMFEAKCWFRWGLVHWLLQLAAAFCEARALTFSGRKDTGPHTGRLSAGHGSL